MKAIVFNREDGMYDTYTEYVVKILMVHDKTPSVKELERLWGVFIQKKLLPLQNSNPQFKDGRDGSLTRRYWKAQEKFIKDNKIDFYSWVKKKYKGRDITFEESDIHIK